MSRLALLLSLIVVLAGCNLSTTESVTPTLGPDQAALTCSQIVAAALESVGPACDSTGRNQACYGNQLVEAQFQDGIQATFDNVGDLTQLEGLRLISTAPMDETAQSWGIALVKAQTNLPDTLPGQNVTFLFYGGATLDSVSPAMEGVVISTGLGGASCESAPPPAVLIQSPDGTQTAMNINGANVTLGSTLYLTAVRNDKLTIATVNGLATVEAFGTSRSVGPGAQVTLPLGGLQIIGPPSEPQPYDLNLISRAPFSLLDHPVQIPPPIAPAPVTTSELPGPPVTNTLPPVTIPLPPTAIPTACVPRTDWNSTYIIQPGDTLFAIATKFGLSLAALQTGNCIADANFIAAGQSLRVPAPPPTATPTEAPPAPVDTPTPTAADFRADKTTITEGECTIVRWDVDNIDSVYFDGKGTTGHGQQEVCPKQSTRYTLLVIHPNGDQVPYFVSITVEPAGRVN